MVTVQDEAATGPVGSRADGRQRDGASPRRCGSVFRLSGRSSSSPSGCRSCGPFRQHGSWRRPRSANRARLTTRMLSLAGVDPVFNPAGFVGFQTVTEPWVTSARCQRLDVAGTIEIACSALSVSRIFPSITGIVVVFEASPCRVMSWTATCWTEVHSSGSRQDRSVYPCRL